MKSLRSMVWFSLFLLFHTELLASDASSLSGLYIIAFSIAIAGVASLIFAASRIKTIKKDYEKIQQTSKELEDKQTQMVASMSEQILSMVKQAVGGTTAIANKIKKNEITEELSSVIESEYKLLDMANDLIEFLRLKSKRVTISPNNYKLDNLLNDLTGFLSKNLETTNLELTYAVDKNIPGELIGDTLKISKILYNIMDYTVEQGATKLVLHVSKTRGFERNYELTFFVKTNLKRDIEKDTSLFKAIYNESNDSYDSLGLFVAKELASLMEGELIARNDIKGNIEFLFSMAFVHPEIILQDDLDTRLLRKDIAIVDTNTDYAQALKTMLETYKHNVMVIKPSEFLQQMRETESFDIIAMDEKLFSAETMKQLEKIPTYKNAKVLALSNYLSKTNTHYYTKDADFKLFKPTTRESLLMLLRRIYLPQEEQIACSKRSATHLKTYTESFEKTPDVTSETFALFKGAKILIVEDDVINQKVVAGVLKHSLMQIDIANDGEECLEFLAREKHYDLILMDINMPKMDGYAATKIIRQDSSYNKVAIISLTALTSPDEIHKMFEVGMNAHLAKPLHKAELFTALDMFLQQTDEMLHEEKPKKLTFEGLDREKGIAKANGSEEFYKEILREFYETYKNSAKIFEKLIHDYRYEQVRMLCLDIKGLAGSIGANELHDLMFDIHQKLIFKKFDMLPEYINPFQEKLTVLNSTIKNYIES
ncbi:MAG: response regulator [Sulfurimonadaceae bacterium]|jgi:CheY-like chemotaxis protein/HPt (histidine-containing phosphotransfer) domain-containing protein|nr:response regulator [Sulfurimonadaceae bacterium]